MSPIIKKLTSIITAIALCIGPISVSAQALADPNAYQQVIQNNNSSGSIFSNSDPFGTGSVIDGYTGAGGGSQFLQQIMGDQTACKADAPQAQNTQQTALGKGIGQGVSQAAIQTLQKDFGNQLQQAVTADLPQRLQNNIQTQLPQVFATNLQKHIQDYGLDPNNISDEVKTAVMQESINQIVKQSMGDSIKNSVPTAVNNSLKQGLASNLPSALSNSLQGTLAGPLQNALLGAIAGNSNIGSNLIDQVTSNIGSKITAAIMPQLTSSIDQITSSLTDGVVGQLDQSINGLINNSTGSINQSLQQVTNSVTNLSHTLTTSLTSPINDLSTGLNGSIRDLTNAFTNPVNNLSTQISQSVGNLSHQLTGAITNPINDISKQISSSFGGMVDNLGKTITNPINQIADQVSGVANNAVQQVVKPVTDLVGNTASGLVTNVLGGSAGGLLGGLVSGSVPVHEVGDLLSVTKDIKTTEDDSKKILIEICGHIKDVRRIELAMEQKEFVQDPQARDQANKLTGDYSKQYYDYLNSGHISSANGEKDSFVIQNYGDYLQSKRDEAARITLNNDLKNSGDIFKDTTREILTKQEAASKNYPASTISKSDYDKLKNPSQLSSNDFTALLTKVYDPTKPNSPLTSYIINNEVLQQAKDRAEQLAIAESQSSGFKPVEECEQKSSDGQDCLKWKIITPSSIVEHNTGTVLDTKVNQLEQVHEVSDLSQNTPTPSVQETQTLKPSGSTAGGSSGFNIGFLSNAFSNLLNRLRGITSGGLNLPGISDGNTSGGNTDSGGSLDVNFNFTSATTDQILSGEANNAFLNWQATGASQCVANNDWLSLKASGNKFETLATKGQDVGTSGSLTLHFPLTFEAKLTRLRDGATTDWVADSIINPSLTQQVSALAISASDIAAGDQFTLTVKNGNSSTAQISTTLTTGSASELNTGLENAINNLSAGSNEATLFGQFLITTGVNPEGTSFITMTINPIYQITCTNGSDSIDKTVNIIR